MYRNGGIWETVKDEKQSRMMETLGSMIPTPYGSWEPSRWPFAGDLTLTIRRGIVWSEGTVLQKCSGKVVSPLQMAYF